MGARRTFAATPTAPFSLASAHSASSSRVPFCSVRMVRRMEDSWEDHSPRHAPVLRCSSCGWDEGVQSVCWLTGRGVRVTGVGVAETVCVG